MAEEERVEVPETVPQPERKQGKQGIADLIASLKGGKTDPITAMLMMSELRRMDRDEERWELDKSQRTNPQKQIDADELVRRVKESLQPEKKFDVEELIEKMNSSWENRFKEYSHHMETLILGKKLEETETRAKQAEAELKETREEIKQEKLLEEKVSEATTPLKNEITELQTVLAQKTAGMSEEERKNVFQNIGGQIEQAITGEVADTIAKNVSQSLMSAFTPKEKEEIAPVTAEGKFDWPKAINKWVTKGLDTAKAIAEKMPAKPPPLRQVQQIPIEIPAEMLRPEMPVPTPTKPEEKAEPVLIKLPKEEVVPEAPKPPAKVEAKEIEVKPAEEPTAEAKPKKEEPPKEKPEAKPQEKKEELKKPAQKPEAKPTKAPAKTKKPEVSHTPKRTEATPERAKKQAA